MLNLRMMRPIQVTRESPRLVWISLIREHGPEFQDLEMRSVEPLAYLPEEDRAAAFQFYGERGKREQGRDNSQRQHGKDYVLATLDPAFPAGNGTNARLEGKPLPQLKDIEHFAAQAFVVAVQKDVHGKVAEFTHLASELRRHRPRHRYIDLIDFVGADRLGQVVKLCVAPTACGI
jgi:hypothetical protein